MAVWQATQVKELLAQHDQDATLVFIKSEGDIDLKTPLYEIGVQGIFTRALDIALLENRIDVAVHSFKDVPTQLPMGIMQAAVLKRGPVNDLLVFKTDNEFLIREDYHARIATSSIRRKAQWLNRYPLHEVHNLRGNVNTRLAKLAVSDWDAAIFAQAGLERINLRPDNSIIIDWMLPAPAQGAIVIVCRKDDDHILNACSHLNDACTALCTKTERDFLRSLLGGCSTPISALAVIENGELHFTGNILLPDGSKKAEIEKRVPLGGAEDIGKLAADEILNGEAKEIAEMIRDAE